MRPLLRVFRRLTLVPQGTIIVMSGFLPIFAIVSMFPALPSIIQHFADNPNARELVPLMVSAPGLAIAVMSPFAGILLDKFGRIPLLVWSTFFYGIFGTMPFFLDSLPVIFATRLLLGVCEGAIITAVNTLIGDYWEDEGRRDWLLLQGIAGPVLGAVVILVAGPATEIRWNGIFLIYGVAFLIFLAMKALLFEPKRPDEGVTTKAVPERIARAAAPPGSFPARPMALVGACTVFASALYYCFIISGGLVFNEIGVTAPSRISELSAVPSLFIILGAVIFRLLGKKPNAVQLGCLFLVLGGGLLAMGIAKTVPALVASLVVQQTGAGMTVATLIAWAQTKLPFEHRGRGMGIWTTSFFFGQFSSPWLVARLEHVTGSVQGAFAVAGLAGIAVGALAFYSTFVRRRATSPAPSA
jgi:MFS family permease